MKNTALLSREVEHIDVTSVDSTPMVDAMRNMSFTARSVAVAADILEEMLQDTDCSVILTVAGSTSAAGCMKIYSDMIRYDMVDVVVATGATLVDMDFYEALGFKHYHGSPYADDKFLRSNYVDRIYDTYIDERKLQACDLTIKKIADELEPGIYSSREFIREMGRYLVDINSKPNSLIRQAYEKNVPVFCPAFSDSSAGFGLVLHQAGRPKDHVSIDCVKDFWELTRVKIQAETTGLFMIGGGSPKNYAQDTVICAELLGEDVPMHKYAVQITVADVRDGGCSGSTLKEAMSWGKVDDSREQMVYAEATSVLPLIVSRAYHSQVWKNRVSRSWGKMF